MRTIAVLILCASILNAAPIGNPATPKMISEGFFSGSTRISMRVGYEGDFVSDERMKQVQESSGNVDAYRQETNSGTATLNFVDRLDCYAVFGGSRTYASWRFSDFDMTNRIEMETGYRFLWAAGARAVLYEWGNATLGAGGRYSQTQAKVTWATLNGTPIPTKNAQLNWNQWQVNLLLSYKIDIFIPYLGINYLSGKTEIGPFIMSISNSGKESIHMTNRSSTGLIIGCALTTGKDFMLNIEGRLIDEEAFDISADLKF